MKRRSTVAALVITALALFYWFAGPRVIDAFTAAFADSPAYPPSAWR